MEFKDVKVNRYFRRAGYIFQKTGRTEAVKDGKRFIFSDPNLEVVLIRKNKEPRGTDASSRSDQ